MALSSKALQTGLSPCARPGAARVCHQTLHQRPRDVSAQGLGDFFKGMMDPLSWTPKSTRIWRLQQYEYPAQDKRERHCSHSQARSWQLALQAPVTYLAPSTLVTVLTADEVDELEARVNEMRRQSSPGPSGAGAVAAAEPGPQASAAADETNLPITGSFEAADDTALAKVSVCAAAYQDAQVPCRAAPCSRFQWKTRTVVHAWQAPHVSTRTWDIWHYSMHTD